MVISKVTNSENLSLINVALESKKLSDPNDNRLKRTEAAKSF